jgi:hypothetical protein
MFEGFAIGADEGFGGAENHDAMRREERKRAKFIEDGSKFRAGVETRHAQLRISLADGARDDLVSGFVAQVRVLAEKNVDRFDVGFGHVP